MRRNSGCGFSIFILLIIAGLISRHIIVAPIFLFVMIFLIVRGVKTKKEKEEEAREQQEAETRERERRQHEAQAREQEARRQYEARKDRERRDQYREFWANANDYQGSRMNSVITCEYCGSRVDTDKYACCNSCGGPYWDNEEWKKIRNYRKGA